MSAITDRVEHLLSVSGQFEAAVANMKEATSSFPDDIKQDIHAKIDSIAPALKNHMIVTYIKHYTEDEIGQMITYFESAVGQKTQKLASVIAADTKQLIENLFKG